MNGFKRGDRVTFKSWLSPNPRERTKAPYTITGVYLGRSSTYTSDAVVQRDDGIQNDIGAWYVAYSGMTKITNKSLVNLALDQKYG